MPGREGLRKRAAAAGDAAEPLSTQPPQQPQQPKRKLTDHARSAYEAGDVEASRAAHAAGEHAENHAGESGRYVKSLVYGGLDGIITTFAIVAATVGGDQSRELVITLGFANLLADGISMGVGDYLSSRSEMEFVEKEMKRESWEVENNLDGEKEEMVELYEKQGLTHEDAVALIGILSKYPEPFVSNMMNIELGLQPPDPADSPLKNGVVTFVAFELFGFVPLISYLAFSTASTGAFVVAIVLTALTLMLLGAAKAQFIGQNKFTSALFMLINGGLAAGAAYLVGWGLAKVLNLEHC